jgi:hypothetical protein
MTNDDRNRAEARFDKATRTKKEIKAGKTEQDAALKAVTDNMARLKALRLAREAAAPAVVAPVKKSRASSAKKSAEKAPALSDWLSSQQGGGRRT